VPRGIPRKHLVGFALGYGITGSDSGNPHGGLILVGWLMFGGATLGSPGISVTRRSADYVLVLKPSLAFVRTALMSSMATGVAIPRRERGAAHMRWRRR